MLGAACCTTRELLNHSYTCGIIRVALGRSDHEPRERGFLILPKIWRSTTTLAHYYGRFGCHGADRIVAAPAAPQGNVLTVVVFLLDGDEVYVGEPGNPYVGVRRFVYRCTTGSGGKLGSRTACVYKTPTQIAIEAATGRR